MVICTTFAQERISPPTKVRSGSSKGPAAIRAVIFVGVGRLGPPCLTTCLLQERDGRFGRSCHPADVGPKPRSNNLASPPLRNMPRQVSVEGSWRSCRGRFALDPAAYLLTSHTVYNQRFAVPLLHLAVPLLHLAVPLLHIDSRRWSLEIEGKYMVAHCVSRLNLFSPVTTRPYVWTIVAPRVVGLLDVPPPGQLVPLRRSKCS